MNPILLPVFQRLITIKLIFKNLNINYTIIFNMELSINNDIEDDSLEKYTEKYIESLTDKEKKVLEIAKEYLETSFNLKKSIGFIKWLKKNKPNI